MDTGINSSVVKREGADGKKKGRGERCESGRGKLISGRGSKKTTQRRRYLENIAKRMQL